MAYNPNLTIHITPAKKAALENAIDALITAINDLGVVALDPKFVRKLQLINSKRMPYVQNTIKNFAPSYPNLTSQAIDPTRADELFEAMLILRELEVKVAEATDRFKDLNYNSQHLLYKYMADMYHTSKRYRSDLPGADVVYQHLNELFGRTGIRKTSKAKKGAAQ